MYKFGTLQGKFESLVMVEFLVYDGIRRYNGISHTKQTQAKINQYKTSNTKQIHTKPNNTNTTIPNQPKMN